MQSAALAAAAAAIGPASAMAQAPAGARSAVDPPTAADRAARLEAAGRDPVKIQAASLVVDGLNQASVGMC